MVNAGAVIGLSTFAALIAASCVEKGDKIAVTFIGMGSAMISHEVYRLFLKR